MNAEAALRSLRTGDVVRLTDTVKVVEVHEKVVHFEDVQNKRPYWITLNDRELSGSLKVEMVKKAIPAPKAGDILTGQEIRDRQWKRGTIIQHGAAASPIVLFADGRWRCLSDEWNDGPFEFEDLNPAGNFTVIHVGQ